MNNKLECPRCYSKNINNTYSEKYGFYFHCKDCDYKFPDNNDHTKEHITRSKV
jgi:transposase-like protein